MKTSAEFSSPAMTLAPGRVTLVTVTYGRRWHLLEQVLASAFEQGIDNAIVVDNGAQDDISSLARAKYGDRVRAIPMGSNTGSAKAFHTGIALACTVTSQFVLLLDDDNKLAEGALVRLLEEHENARKIAPAQLLIVIGFRPVNQFEIAAGATRRVFPRNAFLGFDVQQLPGRIWRRLAGRVQLGPSRAVPALALLDVAPYGGMLFDKSLIDQIGLPNPEFVLYADDTEFSYRVTQRGGRLLLVTAAKVVDIETSWNLQTDHGSGLAKWLKGGTDLSSYYALRNRIYFETHHVPHSVTWRALNRFIFLTGMKLKAHRLGAAARLALLLEAVRDGEARRLGIKPGLELS